MKRTYGVLPWGVILLGVVHMGATWRAFDRLTMPALWFFNGGMMLAVTGVLNLINRAYGAAHPPLRWFCASVNVAVLCFSTVAGVVSEASPSQLLIVLGLLGAITALSLSVPRAPRRLPPNEDRAR